MKFRVKLGTHREGGRVYRKDEVVTTNADLDAMFPEKFERVDGDRSEPRRPFGAPGSPGAPLPKGLKLGNQDEDEEAQPVGDSTQLAGTHVKDTGSTARAGQESRADGAHLQTATISKGAKKAAADKGDKWSEDEDEDEGEESSAKKAAKAKRAHHK